MKQNLLFIIFLTTILQVNCLGPKRFIKEGRFWCRDRVSHPGRQCCDNVSQETPNAIPLQATTTTHINRIDRGYGHSCDTTCQCKTTISQSKCKKDSDCKKDDPKFRCNKGKCKFPCTADSDCTKKFGVDYVCTNKFCEAKSTKKR